MHAPKAKLIEDETTVLWKSFVNGLVAGTLDPNGEKLSPEMQLDPELLAEIMNRGESVESKNLVRNYEEAITSFLKETDRDQLQSQACQETLGRLGDLVSNLKPELRRRFLNSTLKSCSGRHDVASEVLGHLPQAQILEAMEQVDAERLEVPQALMDVLGKMAQQRGASPAAAGSPANASGPPWRPRRCSASCSAPIRPTSSSPKTTRTPWPSWPRPRRCPAWTARWSRSWWTRLKGTPLSGSSAM